MSFMEKDTIPVISIIIPVYNVEKYLEECLISVVNQKIDNYEVIIINDGSTDNSEKIIDKFANKYNFIKKINICNKGAGAARNVGLELATGKYIGFVDSDDFIEEDMLINMINRAEKNKVDIVICDVEAFEDTNRNKKINLNVRKNFYDKNISNKEVLKLYLSDRIQGFSGNKIYKTTLFKENNITYEEGVYYEDIYTILRLITYAKDINLIHESYYKYRQRCGNITSGITTTHINDFSYNLRKCIEFMNKNELFSDLNDYKNAYEISSINGMLHLYYKHFNFNNRDIIRNYNKYFNGYNYKMTFKDFVFNNVVKYKHKKEYLLNKLGLYVKIKNIKTFIKKYIRKSKML